MTRPDTTSARDDEAGEFAALVQRIGADAPQLPLAGPVLDEAAARDAARQAVADLIDKQALDAVLAQVKGDGVAPDGAGWVPVGDGEGGPGAGVAGRADGASGVPGA